MMRRCFDSRCALVSFLIVISGGMPTPHLHAQIDHFWSNQHGGSFFDSDNWIFGLIPPAEDGVVFKPRDQFGFLDANYTVTLDSDHTNSVLEVSNDDVTLDLGGNTYELTLNFFGQPFGQIQVAIDTAHGGEGALMITNGTMLTERTGLGFFAGTTGVLTVDGPDASWTNSNVVNVGIFGTGHLIVSNGANVSANVTEVGSDDGAVGTVIVDGEGSSWTHNERIALGVSPGSSGTLTVSGGADVSNLTTAQLGDFPTSVGVATVDGSGSTWTSTQEFFVGIRGTGDLTISNGGAVTTHHQVLVGYIPGSRGSILVDGPGSTLTNSWLVSVGVAGEGDVTISGGGSVTGVQAVVGDFVNGIGVASVQGAGSTGRSPKSFSLATRAMANS